MYEIFEQSFKGTLLKIAPLFEDISSVVTERDEKI